jgi:hypothetical protein
MPDEIVPPVAAPAPSPAPPEPETFSKDYVRELRAENKGWRLKASEQEAAARTAAEAAKKAGEEAEARIAEHTSKTDQRIIRAELKAVAIKAGIVDLDGLKLVDLKDVKLNAEGEVEGADALIEALKTAKPYLFGAPGSSSTHTPPDKDPPATKKASEMTSAEYAEARKAAMKR